MAIGFETFSLERTCTRTAFYAQSSDSPQRRKTRAMTSDLFFLHRSFFLHSILFSCFRQKIYITTCRALILVTLTFIGMATGNHVSARSRDEGGARGVGATTSRVSDSVIINIIRRRAKWRSHTTVAATIIHVYSKSRYSKSRVRSQFSISNLNPNLNLGKFDD